MSGELFKNEEYKGKQLDLNLSSNRGEVAALGFYYKSAKKQNYQALERLHYLKDGSRDRFNTELQKIPDKYTGFTRLDRVDLGDMYYWGDYVVADVEWFGNGQRLAKWREALACDDYCFISDRFLVTTPSVDAFSAGMYSYAQVGQSSNNIVKRNRLDNELIYLPPAGGGIGYPFTVSFKLADYPSKAILERKTEEDSKPGAETNKDKNNGDAQILFDFVSDVWKQQDAVYAMQETSFTSAEERVNSIYQIHWRDFNPRLLLPMFEFVKSGDGVRETNVTMFTPYAFFQRVASWNKVETVGYMRSESSTYMVVKVTNTDDAESLQVLYVHRDGRGNKGLTANLGEVAVQNIVKTPEFGGKLAVLYLDK